MTIVADKLLNDKSQVVAGGLLTIPSGSVENVSISGERHVTDSGTSTYYYRIRKKERISRGENLSVHSAHCNSDHHAGSRESSPATDRFRAAMSRFLPEATGNGCTDRTDRKCGCDSSRY
ncbi:hypothetical protein SE958_22535 [Escherichia coli]|nr:hypothetical protein [Escherichia coli]